MSDLCSLFMREETTRRWRAERENASARLELALIYEHIAYLISQHEPVASLGIDRNELRAILAYIHHGDINRLKREVVEGKG